MQADKSKGKKREMEEVRVQSLKTAPGHVRIRNVSRLKILNYWGKYGQMERNKN